MLHSAMKSRKIRTGSTDPAFVSIELQLLHIASYIASVSYCNEATLVYLGNSWVH